MLRWFSMIEKAAMMHHVSDGAEFIMDTRLFDGMRFFVTQCAIKTLHRIDDNQSHQPAYSDLILNSLMHVGGMVNGCRHYYSAGIMGTFSLCSTPLNISQVIVNRVNPKRSLSHTRHFAVRFLLSLICSNHPS